MFSLGTGVKLELTSGEIIAPPESWHAIGPDSQFGGGRSVIWIVPGVITNQQPTDSTPEIDQQVDRWFGTAYKHSTFRVDFPIGQWHSWGHVEAVHYARKGKWRGRMRHPFSEPVPLFVESQHRALALVLPPGWLIDWRGFVRP